MKFKIDTMNEYYYITLNSKNIRIVYDIEIANTIGVTLKQYRQELSQFCIVHMNNKVIFYEKNEAKEALKYLINKYGVLAALID